MVLYLIGVDIMNKEKVITVDGSESDWFHKAIFVIRKEVTQTCINKDLSKEAERIISNYAKRNGIVKTQNKKMDKTLDILLTILACILVICLLQLR